MSKERRDVEQREEWTKSSVVIGKPTVNRCVQQEQMV